MNRGATCIVLCAVVVLAGTYAFFRNRANARPDSLYLKNNNYALQTALFDTYKTEHADVVMLGNSLTQWVDWNELLGRTTIANRGIANDVTAGYLHRLEQLYKLTPKLCFVEGGINDIYANVPVEVVVEQYIQIVEELRSHNIIPIIQSTLFVSPRWHDAAEKNKHVAELNTRVETFAKTHSIEFIDLNVPMSTNNFLRDELTHDGVHLTAAGYNIWGTEVENVLRKYNL